MAQEVLTGKVKFFNKEKGFGFIIQDHSEANIFFHHSGCGNKNIKQDDLVSYNSNTGKRGEFAENITVL